MVQTLLLFVGYEPYIVKASHLISYRFSSKLRGQFLSFEIHLIYFPLIHYTSTVVFSRGDESEKSVTSHASSTPLPRTDCQLQSDPRGLQLRGSQVLQPRS